MKKTKNITITTEKSPNTPVITGIENLSPRKIYRTEEDRLVVVGESSPCRVVDKENGFMVHWTDIFLISPHFSGFLTLASDDWKKKKFFPVSPDENLSITFRSEEDEESR